MFHIILRQVVKQKMFHKTKKVRKMFHKKFGKIRRTPENKEPSEARRRTMYNILRSQNIVHGPVGKIGKVLFCENV